MAGTNKIYWFALFTLLVTGCSKELQVKLSAATPAPTSEMGQPVVLTTFQNLPNSQWAVDTRNRLLSNRRQIQFTGTCPRDIYAVQFFDANTQKRIGNPSLCNANHNFTWSYYAPADGELALLYSGRDQNLALAGNVLSKTLFLVTTPPSSPVITTNGGTNFSTHTSPVLIEGTVSPLVSQMTSPSNCTLTFVPNSGVFQCAARLNVGQTSTFSFIAKDAVGNASSPTNISVSYQAQYQLSLRNFSGTHLQNGIAPSRSGNLYLKNLSMNLTMANASTTGSLRLTTGIAKVSQ